MTEQELKKWKVISIITDTMNRIAWLFSIIFLALFVMIAFGMIRDPSFENASRLLTCEITVRFLFLCKDQIGDLQ